MTSAASEAESFLRIGVKRLVRRYPFHAHLIAMGRLVEEHGLTTMGVTVRRGELLFLFNATFVLACDLEQLVGVLHHEVNHVLLGHLLADPRLFPDDRARIIAEEVTVNEFVPESLPGEPILLKHFPQLPVLEDTATRYRRLAAERKQSSSAGMTVDDHNVWKEALASGASAAAVIMSAVERAAGNLTPEEMARIPARTLEAIERARRGAAAGRNVEGVSSAGAATVSWQRELRRFVGQQRVASPTYLRPPRRFPELVGIVPGMARAPGKPRLMVAIDTSGSITAPLLAQIARELAAIGRFHDVIVVECDAAVHRIYPFAGELNDVQGRGGTDLRPPFERAVLSKVRPDAVIYFTDGEGPTPDAPPRIPVLWCLTPGSKVPARWGATVWMR